MKNTHFSILTQEEIPDGLGGYILSDTFGIVGAFKAVKVPLTVEKTLEEHGIVSTKAYKLFSRNQIPEGTHLIGEMVKGEMKKYIILQFVDFGKHKILLVEEVD